MQNLGAVRSWLGTPRGQRIVSSSAVVLWAGIIFYMSSLPNIHLPIKTRLAAKLAHVTEYAVLTGLLVWALRAQRLVLRRAICIAASIAIFYAASDEFHQSFVPNRHPSAVDVMIDGVGIGIVAAIVLGRRHKKLS